MPTLKILGGRTVSELVSDAMLRLPKYQKELEASLDCSGDGESEAPSTAQSSSTGAFKFTDSISSSLSSLPSVKGNDSASAPNEIIEPLSYSQARYWSMQQSMSDSKIGNMAVMFQLQGPLRVDDFEQALRVVALRHEALRTRIISKEAQEMPMLGILPQSTIRSERQRIESQAQAYEELQIMYDHDWDFNSWEAVKVRLLIISDTNHYLIFGAHHISLDATSFSVLFIDLEAAYSSRSFSPMPVTSQYRSFADQQRRMYKSGLMKQSIDFYHKEIPPNLKSIPLLPFAKVQTRQPMIRWQVNEARAHLDASKSAGIKLIARTCRSTKFRVCMAVLQTLLFRYLPDMEDFCIGIADKNRHDQKFMNTMGLLLNFLPLYFRRSPPGTKLIKVVQTSRDKTYAALKHAQLPFNILLNELKVPRSANHTPLYQVYINYRMILKDRVNFGRCSLGDERWCNARSGADLRLEIWETVDGEMNFALKLMDSLYSQESADFLLREYVSLLEEFAGNPDLLCERPIHAN